MIVIGKIGAPHGIKGSANLISYAVPSKNIKQYKIFIKNNLNYIELNCKITVLHSNKIIIDIEDCKDRNKISEYTNILLYTDFKYFNKDSPDEYFWEELIGLKIYDTSNKELGVITQIIETGSHDVLVFKKNDTYLLPFIQGKSIIKIDLSKQSIIIDKNYVVKN